MGWEGRSLAHGSPLKLRFLEIFPLSDPFMLLIIPYVIFVEFPFLILLFFPAGWAKNLKIAKLYLRSALRMVGRHLNRNNFPVMRAGHRINVHITRPANCLDGRMLRCLWPRFDQHFQFKIQLWENLAAFWVSSPYALRCETLAMTHGYEVFG